MMSGAWMRINLKWTSQKIHKKRVNVGREEVMDEESNELRTEPKEPDSRTT